MWPCICVHAHTHTHSTVAALRGEMGSSLVRSRVMETTLQYVRSVMNGSFTNIREMMLHTIERKTGKWYRTVNGYVEELGLNWTDIYQMSKMDLKNIIREHDTRIWEETIASKTTLKYYREGKNRIGYDHCYRNNVDSMFLARARVNSLGLEEAKGRGIRGYNKRCKLCELEEEDLLHFMMICPNLEKTRKRHRIIDNNIRDPKNRMLELLFIQNEHQKVGSLIRNLWNKRKQIIDYKENKKKQCGIRKIIQGSDPGPERNVNTYIRKRSDSVAMTVKGC